MKTFTDVKMLKECCTPMWYEQCVESGRVTPDYGGEWCVNCGGWVSNEEWGKHRKRCLSRKH